MKILELDDGGRIIVARELSNDEIAAVWRSHFERMDADPKYAAKVRAEAEL